jgi:hypothetical protein
METGAGTVPDSAMYLGFDFGTQSVMQMEKSIFSPLKFYVGWKLKDGMELILFYPKPNPQVII